MISSKSPVLGKPFGFKSVDPFFSIEAADALFGPFFLVRGDEIDVLSFNSSKDQPKTLSKAGLR